MDYSKHNLPFIVSAGVMYLPALFVWQFFGRYLGFEWGAPVGFGYGLYCFIGFLDNIDETSVKAAALRTLLWPWLWFQQLRPSS